MRTRTRNIVHSSINRSLSSRISYNTYCNGTSSAPANAGAFAFNIVTSATEETMTDALGKGQSHYCLHRKMYYSINEDPFYTANIISNGSGVTHNDGAQASTGPYSARSLMTPYLGFAGTGLPTGWTMSSISADDELHLKEDVIERARGLKADVLLNLIEANQIWPSINSLTLSLPAMAANWNRIRKLIRTASGSYLAWKFGISPLLHDMMAVNRYLPRMRADIQRHVDGDSTRFSGNAVPSVTFTVAPSTGFLNGYLVDKREFQGLLKGTPSIRYVLVVKPTTKYSMPFFQKADAFMSKFATSPASLLWEKIPFSFIVDWFVDLRGTLRTLDSLLGFSPYQVVSFTRSFSYHLETQGFWGEWSPCDGSSLFDVRVGTVEYKHYERSLVSMGGSPPTWTPRFGKNQAGISAALISQQLSKL